MIRATHFLSCVLYALIPAMALSGQSPSPVKVLIVDGFGNHDWHRTTQLIQGVLGRDPGFEVEVSTVPSTIDDPAYKRWLPTFRQFDVVMQTCNDINGSGPLWPEQARKDFETWVDGGGGVFVFHSGNNAFAAWDAYNLMIGMGWRPKDYGTAIRIRVDGSLERIPPGTGQPTGHGPRTDRQIHRMGNHPIHAGLPKVWMTPLIEVYTYPRGPAQNLEVLSWAADPVSEERWPIEWVVQYGKGRIYTSTFGHVWKDEKDPVGMRCSGFQTILPRALHWLAGREVGDGVPSDFPTADTRSLRPLPEL